MNKTITGYLHDPLRKAGVAVVTGALVLSITPVTSAFAADSASTATTTTAAETSSTTDSTSGAGNAQGTPPAMPDGEAPSGAPGDGNAPSDGSAPDMPEGGQPGGGADTMTFDYSGSYSGALTADGEEVASDGEAIDASETDQNAALAENGGILTITNGTLTKSGDDTNGDNCNFYGLNSILLAVGEGSKAVVSDTSLSATSEGSNGIFATDSGTVYANNVTINTTAANSRGLDATYGGTIIGADIEVTTQGDHCAAFATDRGGGNISVDGATLSTAGSGSPLIYSTGDIEVTNATGTATGSQIAGMEGLNTILISDSDLTSTQTQATASDPVADGIIIYQSTSGDAESTTGEAATFQVVDSTLTSAIESGSMFYLTNTTADVLVQNTTLGFDSDAADLIYAAGNDANNWGTAGSNGATVSFTARDEEMSGDVVADTISSVDLYLLDESTWTGAASIEENANGSTSEAPITVNVESGSTWVVTADSTVSALNVEDGGKVVDADGKTVTIVADGETVVEGDSDLIVTVTGSYSTTVDTSAAATAKTDEDKIDRSGFEETFGTSTLTASENKTSSDSEPETTQSQGGQSWWDAVVSWFKGLFGAE
ncbi:MAG: hypothetical protein U0L51_05415 [Olegusella sp.]|nr:hypothetical protein [Olegusella sp.]